MDMKLQMLIEAQNRAEGQLKAVQKQLADINAGLTKTGESANKSSSIFTKAFAYKAVAITTVIKLMKDSIQAYAEEERANKRLETLMMNVKGATMEQVGLLRQQAQAMQELTTVQDDVVVSGQSQLATFQLQAGTIAQLTPSLLDLAVAVNGVSVSQDQMISMANLLGKAMTGSAGALTKFGVTMSESQKKLIEHGSETQKAATMTQVLKENFGGLAKEMKNTLEGRLESTKNKFGDIKEEIGKKLKPVMTDFLIWMSDVGIPAVGRAIDWLSKAWASNMGYIRSITEATGWAIKTAIKGWSEMIVLLSNALDNLGSNKYLSGGWELLQKGVDYGQAAFTDQSVDEVTADRMAGMRAMKGQSASGILDSSLDAAFGKDYSNGSGSAFNSDAQDKADRLRKLFAGGGGSGGSGSGGGSDTAKKEVEVAKKLQEDLIDRLGKARQGYRDLTGDATKDLSDLKVAHDKNMADINKSIEDLKTNLASLTQTYNDTIKGLDMSAGERVVQQQQKIKELQSQINDMMADGKDTSAIQKQLAEEKAALEKFTGDRKDLVDEITEAQRRAGLTDFERFVEDLKVKRDEADKDFKDKKDKIDQEIQALEDQKTRESEIYASKRQEYLDTLATFDIFKTGYIDGLVAMETRTETSVKAMEARLAYLKRLLADIEATTSTIKEAQDQESENAALPRAFGGSIFPGQRYKVGERGEEEFISHHAGRIEPNGGSKSYNISIPISVNGAGDPAKVMQMIEQRFPAILARTLQLKKAGVPANV